MGTSRKAQWNETGSLQPESQLHLAAFDESHASILSANELSPATVEMLRQANPVLLKPEAILGDNSGRAAEQYAQIVLQQEGMPDGQTRRSFDSVVEGKTDLAHGIDLVGVRDGVPTVIEVKKREGSDAIGYDRLSPGELHPGVEKWVAGIEAERARSPFRAEQVDSILRQAQQQYPNNPEQWSDFDPELSPLQMGEMWTRDRWLKAVDNPESRDRLLAAGVDARFLDASALADNPHSSEWKQILEGRAVVIVQGPEATNSDYSMRDAIFRRRVDLVALRI